MQSIQLEPLERIARALEAVGISYMIIGGQAVLFYGEPRLTKDIDITLAANVDDLARVLTAVELANLHPLVDPQEFVAQTMVLPCQDSASGLRVDLIFSFSPYEQQAIERAVRAQVGNTIVRFASAEDLIIHKIIAGRERDLEDVERILRKRGDMDFSYIENWLQQFAAVIDAPLVEELEKIRSRVKGQESGRRVR